MAMVKAEAGCDASRAVVLQALHAHGLWFRKLREKPLLTPEDVRCRLSFGKAHLNRTPSQWLSIPHAIIDNKHFPLYVNPAGREHAARRAVRGAFRSPRDGLKPHLVKPKGTLKFPAQSVAIAAAVIKGKIRMWHEVKGNWTGQAAADMYSGPLRKALQAAYPNRRSWVVMEDNDPSGYKSRKGLDAKRESRITSMDLPKRSPDCNPLDYSLWHEINVRMREQERGFKKNFKESREAYLKRLRRVALTLPPSVVKKAVRDMKRRVQELVDKKGGLITE